MKTIIFTLMLVLSVHAFRLESTNITIPNEFINDLSVIISKMENSCTETVENVKNEKYPVGSILKIKIKIDCDYRDANEMFKVFYNTYGEYLNGSKYERVIDSTVHANFPQYEVCWGTRFNSQVFPFIKRVLPYNASLSNNNKCMFYYVVADSDTVGVVLASFSGYALDYANKSVMSDTFYYKIILSKQTISDVNLVKTTRYDMEQYNRHAGILIDLD